MSVPVQRIEDARIRVRRIEDVVVPTHHELCSPVNIFSRGDGLLKDDGCDPSVLVVAYSAA
eukprot:5174152-Pyramimonas_sp.AAC.1